MTIPSPSASHCVQSASGEVPSAIFTHSTISSMLITPFPPQSPAQGRMGVVVEVTLALGKTVPVGLAVIVADGVTVSVALDVPV